MSVSFLSCPHCRSSFKMHKVLPIGIDIPCPKCKLRFTVSNELIRTGKSPASAGAAGSSANVNSPGLGQPLASSASPSMPSAPQEPAETGSGSSGRFIAVIAGAIAVLALAVGAYYFLGQNNNNPTPISANNSEKKVGDKENGDKEGGRQKRRQ